MGRVLAALVVLATVAVSAATRDRSTPEPVLLTLRPVRSLVTQLGAPGGAMLTRSDTGPLVVGPRGTTLVVKRGRLHLVIPDPIAGPMRGWDTTTARRALGRLATGESLPVVANSSPEPPAKIGPRPTNVTCALDRLPEATLTLCVTREITRVAADGVSDLATTVVARAEPAAGYRVERVTGGRPRTVTKLAVGAVDPFTVSMTAIVRKG